MSIIVQYILILVVAILILYKINQKIIDKYLIIVYNRITFFFGHMIKSIIN